MPSEKKNLEQEVCPFLEYTQPSGPGVYHIGGLWCAGIAFRGRVTEEQATNFCLGGNYRECYVVQLIPTERKASLQSQVWPLKKVEKAKEWLSKHQRDG